MRIGVKPGQWGWSFNELVMSWRAAEMAGFDIVACFDHVTASPRPAPTWDAPTLLAAMASETERTTVAVRVLNIALRHPFLLAAQLAVVQAVSAGRLDVGLGAGSFGLARHDHERLGIPFPSLSDRMTRLEATCRILRPLWEGQTVSEAAIGLSEASLGQIDIVPPRLVVGGSSVPAMKVAALHAEGWNMSTADPEEFERARLQLDRVVAEAGRAEPVAAEAQLWVRDLWADQRSHLTAFRDAGAEAVILVLDEERGPEQVRRLGEAVL